MTGPLRWIYSNSYKHLKELAEAVGVHSYEYQALIDMDISSDRMVIIQQNTQAWEEAFTDEELTMVGERVSTFLSEVVHDMVEAVTSEYLTSMSQREI
ncbi:MAG: hypothetical protein M1600_09325 [Firmicutes bacterium]|jgi:hypothetical protein|nr:hypothetical protein [Bacillota bacterium]